MWEAPPPKLWLPPKPAIIRKSSIRENFIPMFAPVSGSAPPPANAWIGATNLTTNLTTYTFTAASLGTAHADRYVIVGVASVAGFARTISSATIGGVAATLNHNQNLGFTGRIISAAVPTGATGDVVLTFSGAMTSCAIGVWAAYNIGSD
jgi:hypothetical protein